MRGMGRTERKGCERDRFGVRDGWGGERTGEEAACVSVFASSIEGSRDGGMGEGRSEVSREGCMEE